MQQTLRQFSWKRVWNSWEPCHAIVLFLQLSYFPHLWRLRFWNIWHKKKKLTQDGLKMHSHFAGPPPAENLIFASRAFHHVCVYLTMKSKDSNIYRAPSGSRYTIFGEQVLSPSSYVRWKGKAPLYSKVFVSCFTNSQLWVRERVSILRTGSIAHRASHGSQEGIVSLKAKAWDQLSLLYIFLIYILTISKSFTHILIQQRTYSGRSTLSIW